MLDLRRKKPTRSLEQRREHYEIEKSLAARLRTATADERKTLYQSSYNELFRRVPHHPQLTRIADPKIEAIDTNRQLALLRRFLGSELDYLEIGAGDCRVANRVAETVRSATAIEVSEEIVRTVQPRANLQIRITEGVELPVASGSIDLAYSNQLLEHLHPEDARDQVAEVFRCLRPDGRYLCITPNALSGPHDISGQFDDQPTGFHLREYTVGDIVALFRSVGFRRFRVVLGARGEYLPFSIPTLPIRAFEGVVRCLPRRLRRGLCRTAVGRVLLGINLVATK